MLGALFAASCAAIAVCASDGNLEGRWVLKASSLPETVILQVHADSVDLQGQCSRAGGPYRLEGDRLVLADQLITMEGPCLHRFDRKATTIFHEIMQASPSQISLVRDGSDLVLSDPAGRRLTFVRARADRRSR